MNKLCLGTVQLGMKYGIKNAIGRQPTLEESYKVLQQAVNYGIEYFDTASLYGNAENVLGSFGLAKRKVNIISKLPPSGIDTEEEVLGYIKESLKRLQTGYLDGYLLHNPSNFYNKNIWRGLLHAKENRLVQHIGVSIYDPKDAVRVVTDPDVDYIQIPYNVFDQRLDQTEFFSMVREHGIKVFARSAFLQGLLLMNKVPDTLQEGALALKKFQTIVGDYHYTQAEAAFLFSYCHPGIDFVVFGVETLDQLKYNLRIIDKVDGFSACRKQLIGKFDEIPNKIVNPSLWEK